MMGVLINDGSSNKLWEFLLVMGDLLNDGSSNK